MHNDLGEAGPSINVSLCYGHAGARVLYPSEFLWTIGNIWYKFEKSPSTRYDFSNMIPAFRQQDLSRKALHCMTFQGIRHIYLPESMRLKFPKSVTGETSKYRCPFYRVQFTEQSCSRVTFLKCAHFQKAMHLVLKSDQVLLWLRDDRFHRLCH